MRRSLHIRKIAAQNAPLNLYFVSANSINALPACSRFSMDEVNLEREHGGVELEGFELYRGCLTCMQDQSRLSGSPGSSQASGPCLLFQTPRSFPRLTGSTTGFLVLECKCSLC